MSHLPVKVLPVQQYECTSDVEAVCDFYTVDG